MTATVCFTSVSCSYLPRARLLAASVRRWQPDWHVWAVLVDVPPPALDLRSAFQGFDRVLDARALVPGSFGRWVFGHDVVSACCAVKGAALLRLLERGASRVVYLDPDVVLFAPLPPLDAPVSLTPHRLWPGGTTPAGLAAAADTRTCGVFNLGFLAVTATPQGRAFARWWAARLERCVDDPAAGLFLDQRYCDHVPALFPGAEVLRDPGCNVATWNLDQRPLSIDGNGCIQADGAPLRFMHFSKHGGVGERGIQDHADSNPVAMELWAWYGRALRAESARTGPAAEWRWANDYAGRPVDRAARAAWRDEPDLRDRFADPFEVGGNSFGAWWAALAHPDGKRLPNASGLQAGAAAVSPPPRSIPTGRSPAPAGPGGG